MKKLIAGSIVAAVFIPSISFFISAMIYDEEVRAFVFTLLGLFIGLPLYFWAIAVTMGWDK